MGRRRSHTRLGVPRPGFSFELFILCADERSCAVAREVRPQALRLTTVTELFELMDLLKSHSLVCGVIVDSALDEHDRMVRAIRRHGFDLPALVLVRSATARALEAAHAIAPAWVFTSEPAEQQKRKMALFMRGALDGQLWRTARLIQQAREHDLSEIALETFVALVILQLPRREAARRLRIAGSSLEKRISVLCRAWGVDRLAQLTMDLSRSVVKDAPIELVHRLEQDARAALEVELSELAGECDLGGEPVSARR